MMTSEEILSAALEDTDSVKETMGDRFKKSPLTVLIFYRGWW